MKKLLLLVAVLLSSVFAQNLYAQGTGKIAGKVLDSKTNETLIGASVLITGTNKGAATNIDGRYTLSGLAAGRYKVEVKYLGYQTKSISDVEVKNGAVTNLDVILTESSTQALGEVVIQATYKQESVASLYAQQKNSVRISDGISAQAIRLSPDKNTGEVIKRVSGATVQDNRFVFVRGLSDRYNSYLLNNSVLPSSEPDRKTFSFDVIPSGLIDNVLISKSATPDLPGDFAGGVVQVNTRDFPDQKFLNIQVGASYNSRTTFKDFKRSTTGDYDFLGFDDGSRKLPSAFAKVKTYYNNSDLVSSEQRAAISQTFPNTFGVRKQFSATPLPSIQLAFGNSKNYENGNKLGYIASVNYRSNYNKRDRNRSDYAQINGAPAQLFNYNDELYSYSNNLGALFNVSYAFKKSKIALKNFFSNTFYNNYADRFGEYNESGQVAGLKGSQTDVTQNGLFNTSLEGQHQLDFKKMTIDWGVSYGYSYRNQPDQRTVIETNRPNDAKYPTYFITLTNRNNPAIQNAGRVYQDLSENILGGRFNATLPYKLFGEANNKLKAGYMGTFRDRTFDINALGYATNNGTTMNYYLENGLTADNIFSRESMQDRNIILSVIPGNSFSYNGKVNLNAGYISSENNFGEKWRAIFGARIENYQQTITPTGNAAAKQNYNNTDILPSVNLTYKATEKSNVRLSAYQAVNRPELRELASFIYYDFETDYTVRGEPNLKRAQITNVDLRYELFPSSGQVFSVSAFYKYFKNPIEQFNGGNKDFTFRNANNAKDYGAEVELRKTLDFISPSPFLKRLTFYANAAYIKSEVDADFGNADRPLQGQSPYILNGGLQYANTNGDLTFNLLYNKIGQRLVFVGPQGGFDTYERPRDLIDFQIGKKFSKNKAEIKLNINDLLAQDQILYYNFDAKNSYNSGKDKAVQLIKPGTNVSLTLNYNF